MIFRCTSTWNAPTSASGRIRIFEERRCEERRWHTGWHHATWTWWPFDPNAPAEYRTIEWSGEPDHPFERETVFPVPPTTLTQFVEQFGQTGVEAVAATSSIPTPMVATTDGPTCPTCGSHGPANGCLDKWHYTLPQSTIRFEVDREPLMKAHIALLTYGRHEKLCPWAYPPIEGTDCTCGLAEAIRISCTNIEADH